MILTSADRAKEHVASGAWNQVTLDHLFNRTAAENPDATVFADVGKGVVPGLAARFTYGEAARRIDGLAAFFAGVGLKPDMVLGIHLPPCADAAIIILAALRAGLVICPLPVYWTKTEIEAAIEAASIKAMVTASEIEDDPSGELIRDVAADTFAIRFVFAVGSGLPDGLIDLSEVLSDIGALGEPPEIGRRGEAAEHVALLSLARTPDDELLIVPYNHNQIMASAVGHLIEAGIGRGANILSTMHPASLASVAGAIATGLIAGGTIAFHHGTTLAGLVSAATEAAAQRVVLPEPLGATLAGRLGAEVGLSLVATGFGLPGPAPLPDDRPAVDLLTLGGLCLIARARTDRMAVADFVAGPCRMGGPETPVLYQTRLKPKTVHDRANYTQGELMIGGAAIADAPWPEPQSGHRSAMLHVTSDGFLRTGLSVREEDDRLVVAGPLAETITIAGTTLSPKRLDRLFGRHPAFADAAVFPIEAGPIGHRLGLAVVAADGEMPALDDVLGWMDEEGAGALDRPVMFVVVDEIPRAADGEVRRDALFLKAVA